MRTVLTLLVGWFSSLLFLFSALIGLNSQSERFLSRTLKLDAVRTFKQPPHWRSSASAALLFPSSELTALQTPPAAALFVGAGFQSEPPQGLAPLERLCDRPGIEMSVSSGRHLGPVSNGRLKEIS